MNESGNKNGEYRRLSIETLKKITQTLQQMWDIVIYLIIMITF